MICRANQWTGFYMIEISVMKELRKSVNCRSSDNFVMRNYPFKSVSLINLKHLKYSTTALKILITL